MKGATETMPAPTRPARKVTVRKAGSVRLTATASAAYIPWVCWPF